jgi:hypothetical protein
MIGQGSDRWMKIGLKVPKITEIGMAKDRE